MSGYVSCACRDCFEVAIGDGGLALCNECEEAGCVAHGEEAPDGYECCAPGAYASAECDSCSRGDCAYHDGFKEVM